MTDAAVTHVSDTSLWVAYYRAVESGRPDALFRDPYAARLAGSRGREIAAAMTGARYTGWSVVIRTCIIDKTIRDFVADGLIDTVINLGAGLDARPYRLELPSTMRWIEVDYAHVIDHKERLLAGDTPRCRLERIRLDLADRPARQKLFSALAGKTRQALILTEGVVPYLSVEQVAELADDLRAQAPFAYWLLEYFSPRVAQYMQRGRLRKQLRNAPFKFFPPDWHAFFEEHGWRQREIQYLPEVSLKLGRKVPIPWWVRLLRIITPRKRLDEMRRFAGYVLLEPKRGA